jgi:hypothetical protein
VYVLKSLLDHIRDAFAPDPYRGYSLTQKFAILILALLCLLAAGFFRYQFIKSTVRDAIREERREPSR